MHRATDFHLSQRMVVFGLSFMRFAQIFLTHLATPEVMFV